jgi:hypothetical protein
MLLLLGGFNTISHAQTVDKRLMSDADYNVFLLQVKTALPKWEAALKNIDPEKDPQISYAIGKMVVQNRDVGLMEVGYIRTYVAKLQTKRTVTGELALSGFLMSLLDSMNKELDWEAIANGTLSDIEKYAPELVTLNINIGNDVRARVALLEKGTCP